jgi:hypothetical protein
MSIGGPACAGDDDNGMMAVMAMMATMANDGSDGCE